MFLIRFGFDIPPPFLNFFKNSSWKKVLPKVPQKLWIQQKSKVKLLFFPCGFPYIDMLTYSPWINIHQSSLWLCKYQASKFGRIDSENVFFISFGFNLFLVHEASGTVIWCLTNYIISQRSPKRCVTTKNIMLTICLIQMGQ